MRTLLPNFFCHIKKTSESDEEGMKATQNRNRYNVGIGTM